MLNGGGDSTSPRVRRQHGFQLPLHPLQVSGWLALVVLSIGAFLLIVPALPPHAQSASSATLSTLLLLHIAAHLSAALVDPGEEAIRSRPPDPVPQLDRTKHAHVIEEGHCNLCDIRTTSHRTKHCSACNKCISNFDHHCKWLNHCVGGRNYAPFLMCVSTAVAAAALVAILAIVELALHHSHWLDTDKFQAFLSSENSTSTTTRAPPTSSLPTGDAAFLAVVAALGILAAITAGLLLHLCFFHIYISFLGLTTYEYIRQQRQNQSQPQLQQQSDEDQSTYRCSTLRHRPVNLITCGGDGRTSSHTTLVTCTVLEETFTSCGNNGTEPTPTPPTTPQDCQLCVSNSVGPAGDSVQPNQKKLNKSTKWNCCLAVPDSPDSPNEPKCLVNLCKYKIKNRGLPAIEGRPGRTHGHWSSAKLRMIFRVIGNLGHHRRSRGQPPSNQTAAAARSNQVVPVSNDSTSTPTINPSVESVQTVNNLVPVSCYPDVSRRANTLPALPITTTTRRRLVSEMELANALTLLQQQQQRCTRIQRSSQYRRRRRSVVHRTITPALSPIRESGLSNPASPSHQNCTVAAISGTCTRPF